ncbi:hypothetical protein Tco_0052818 [Tanacetum coccineum]
MVSEALNFGEARRKCTKAQESAYSESWKIWAKRSKEPTIGFHNWYQSGLLLISRIRTRFYEEQVSMMVLILDPQNMKVITGSCDMVRIYGNKICYYVVSTATYGLVPLAHVLILPVYISIAGSNSVLLAKELRYCAQCLIIENEDFVKEIAVLNAHIRYHLKELRYCAQCLIIENEDFVKRSRWVSQELRYCAQCLIIENEDFVKEIAVCLYIRSMSSTSWIVQDIRHKLGRFNFFIKFVILYFLHQKSTTGGCQFLGNRLISWQCKKKIVVVTSTTEAEYVADASCCGQVGDEAVHKELGDRMERAATTASSLEAEQDNGNIK